MKWIKGIMILCIFVVSGVQANACTVSATALNFGDYERNRHSESIGTVSVTCGAGVAFAVKLSPGQRSGGTFNPRKMGGMGGTDMINYNLYRNAALTEIWGDGAGNTFIQTGVGTNTETRFRVYGRIPAGQNVKSGFYSDSVTVTVEW